MSDPIGGIDWVAVEDALWGWVVAGCALDETKVVWAQQDAPRPQSPAIELRISNNAETGPAWQDTEDNPLTFTPLAITAVDPTANTLAHVAHTLQTGDGPVQLTTSGTLPNTSAGPLALLTDYWVIAPDADHIQLAATFEDTGGLAGAGNPVTPIDLIDAGTGTITISATADTVRSSQELRAVSRSRDRITLELHCHAVDGVSMNMATAILDRVRKRVALQSQIDRLDAANIGFIDCDRVRAIQGTRDALLFEPRAYLEIHFNVPSQEGEPLRRIDKAAVTNLTTGIVTTTP